MALIHEQAAFMRDVRRLLEYAEGRQLLVTGGELERSPEAQARQVQQGRSRSRSMDDLHLRKCAIDLNFFVEREGHPEWVHRREELEPLGVYWEGLDPRNRWGGRGKGVLELAHFERDLGAWPSQGTSALEPPAEQNEPTAVATPERPGTITTTPPAGQRPALRRGQGERGEVLVLQEKLVQQDLLEAADGVFGPATEKAVRAFQQRQGLVADGVVGAKTWAVLEAAGAGSVAPANTRWLGDGDLEQAAASLGVELAAVRAVYQVESNGRGFAEDQPKILFEGHIFWRQLKAHGLDPQRLASGNEDILYAKWTRAFYGSQAHERERLRRARAIHPAAAAESASWGLFQIMGFHWQHLNTASPPAPYQSAEDFAGRMGRHERDQLEAFCLFLRVTRGRGGLLVDLLRQRDWPAFAYAYNGSGYRANAYDDKLRAAYLHHTQTAT
ncbi:MAG: DUF3380 domain-containing protein [Candidatus Latescibacteria bacterium]|nr:DUF3380 domain-containing protein [Candidatus Latescibacterota bacterium]